MSLLTDKKANKSYYNKAKCIAPGPPASTPAVYVAEGRELHGFKLRNPRLTECNDFIAFGHIGIIYAVYSLALIADSRDGLSSSDWTVEVVYKCS